MSKIGKIIPRNYKSSMPYAVRAEGIYIYDETGKRYIDGCCGALISNIGECVPEVVAAITEQLHAFNFAHPSRWRSHKVEEAAEELAELLPGDLNNSWFVSGGSEAIESAIKLARQYYVERDGDGSSKSQIIGRWNSYHGANLGCMAVAGNMPRRRVFAPMFKEQPKIQPHYCYRCPYGLEYPDCGIRCAHELDSTIKRLGRESVAAFLAEPIVGSSVGALTPPDEYWPIVRKICSDNDVLLIADEVMTGMGRTGKAFCVDHWNVTPDIIASAKGLAAGYVPAGGVFAPDSIMDLIRTGSGHFLHGYTYNGNPVTGAAVLAVVKYIKKNRLIENAARQGEVLQNELLKLKDIPIVGDVRGKGLMRGIEIVADVETREPFPSVIHASSLITEECMKRGLIIYPSGGMVDGGTQGDNFMVAPALIVTKEEIVEIVSILHDSLSAVSQRLLASNSSRKLSQV